MAEDEIATALPLAAVIHQAVSQCAEAQHAVAQSMWEYIEDAAFTSESGKREVAMLSFDFLADGRRGTVRMPLLSVLPAQYIQIRDVEIDFNVSIDVEQSKNIRSCPVRMAPSRKMILRRNASNYDLHNNISVSIRAGNLDMSSGMARLLEMAGSRAVLIQTPDEKK